MSNRQKHIEWRRNTLIETYENFYDNYEKFVEYCERNRRMYIYRLEMMSDYRYDILRKEVLGWIDKGLKHEDLDQLYEKSPFDENTQKVEHIYFMIEQRTTVLKISQVEHFVKKEMRLKCENYKWLHGDDDE